MAAVAVATGGAEEKVEAASPPLVVEGQAAGMPLLLFRTVVAIFLSIDRDGDIAIHLHTAPALSASITVG
jgi:hypothetical protein